MLLHCAFQQLLARLSQLLAFLQASPGLCCSGQWPHAKAREPVAGWELLPEHLQAELFFPPAKTLLSITYILKASLKLFWFVSEGFEMQLPETQNASAPCAAGAQRLCRALWPV